jgi:hypothetical protein
VAKFTAGEHVTQKSRLSGSLRSLQGKKSPDRRFFEILCAKRDKLLGACCACGFLCHVFTCGELGHKNHDLWAPANLRFDKLLEKPVKSDQSPARFFYKIQGMRGAQQDNA